MHQDLRDIHILGSGTYQRLVPVQRCPSLDRLGIVVAGLSLCRGDFRRQEQRPATGVVSVVLPDAGGGEVLADGDWRPAPLDSVYLSPPGLRRGWRCHGTWHIGWLEFRADKLPSGFPDHPCLRSGHGEALAESIRMLWREQLRAEPAPLVIAHAVDLIGIHLRRLIGAEGPHGRLERLWQAVDADLSAPWTLASMAASVGVGAEQFRRLCRQAHGESPVARLRRLRLERAEALLNSTPLSIAAVAEAVGYADPEAFATAFRRHFACTPSTICG